MELMRLRLELDRSHNRHPNCHASSTDCTVSSLPVIVFRLEFTERRANTIYEDGAEIIFMRPRGTGWVVVSCLRSKAVRLQYQSISHQLSETGEHYGVMSVSVSVGDHVTVTGADRRTPVSLLYLPPSSQQFTLPSQYPSWQPPTTPPYQHGFILITSQGDITLYYTIMFNVHNNTCYTLQYIVRIQEIYEELMERRQFSLWRRGLENIYDLSSVSGKLMSSERLEVNVQNRKSKTGLEMTI